MSVVRVGFQCQLDYLSSSVYFAPNGTVSAVCPCPNSLCHPPISVWSSSFVFSFQYFEYHYLEFPVVAHSGDVPKQAHFPPYCFSSGSPLSCPLNLILCHLLFSLSISLS